jgi:hypothetical protein
VSGHKPGADDAFNPLLETRDTERLAVNNNNPDTVRTEMLKTDITRMQFGGAGLPRWLRRLILAYACGGAVVLIVYIIVAVSLS